MKRFISFLVLFISYCSISEGKTYLIVKLNTPSIRIGPLNRVCKVGSKFEESEEIKWDSPKQDMWVKAITGSNRELLHYNREMFVSIGAKSPLDYYHKINHPSTMGTEFIGENKASFPEKRIALIIGNSNYFYLPTLNNPVNDATDIAKKLQSLGFDTRVLYDVTYSRFGDALKKFSGDAKDGYEVALVYYVGHGIQYKNIDYLIPIDNELSKSESLDKCIPLDDVYYRLTQTKCPTKLVFIDACRNESPWDNRNEELNNQENEGIGILFSTGYNKFAYASGDNDRNSPFAEAFLENVGKPSSLISSTVNAIINSMEEICERRKLLPQKPQDWGMTGINFTFVNASSSLADIDYSSLNKEKLEELAQSGDVRAYVPLANYHLKNTWSGVSGYEQAHIYAVKAIEANVDIDAAKKIIQQLDLLRFYDYNESNIKKPSF